MRVFGGLLRVFSYIFHFVLALFLLGISIVTVATGQHILSLGMLPWRGETLTWWLLGSSLVGILSIVLAVTGRTRWLFVLYTLVALALMVRGFFLTSYNFGGPAVAKGAAWLTFGALGAFFGSLMDINEPPKKRSW